MSFCSAQKSSSILIDNGKSVYQIVIPSKPTDVEREASQVLQTYLFKVSGFSLPIIYEYENRRSKNEIHIGKTVDSKGVKTGSLANDGFSFRVSQSKLFLQGGDRKGVLYAVYSFLEDEIGCKKYTKDVEFIPKKKVISVSSSLNVIQNPSFEYRTTYFEDSLDKTYSDWNKLNYFFEDRLYNAHTFQVYVPEEKYFKSHPEYFALVDGKRIPSQLCLSNRNVYQLIRDGLERDMKKCPRYKYWSVSQNDDERFCHCNDCNKLRKDGKDFSEILIPFVNKLAKEFPTKIISTLAYHRSIEAPIYSSIEPNVEIMLCFTHLNRNVPLATGGENAKMFREFLNQWKLKTNDIFAWDYVNNYNNTLSPFPNIPILQPNLQFLKSQGIKKVFLNGIGNQKGEFSELKTYIISKLLWDVNADVEKLKVEFCNAFYGSAAKDVLDYIQALESTAKKTNAIVDVWANPILNKNDFLSQKNINLYKSILNKGLLKVKENPVLYSRVLKEYASLQYAEIEIASQDNNRLQELGGQNELQKKIILLQDHLKSTKVHFLRNGEQSIEDYKKSKEK
ncbi:DUF4838 domain-containing protein [Empedobacter sp.]|uniref:DUF4838 domain-containing protein n=1 Tax=Empedobacter sp. TaxID=1927715 RepID=UPI0028A9BCD3|nr:DUF4838 domain-containing protein [Empedobacter sp.]